MIVLIHTFIYRAREFMCVGIYHMSYILSEKTFAECIPFAFYDRDLQ